MHSRAGYQGQDTKSKDLNSNPVGGKRQAANGILRGRGRGNNPHKNSCILFQQVFPFVVFLNPGDVGSRTSINPNYISGLDEIGNLDF
jgi:hypothetical protein